MKLFLRIILLLLVILCGAIAIKIEFGPYEIDFLSNLKYIPLFFFLAGAIISFLIELNNYQKNKKFKEFPVTLIALLFSLPIVLRIAKRDIIEAKSTVIKVSSLRNVYSKMTFEFKEGNDFKLTMYNGGTIDIYHGNYSKSHDTIKIKSSNYDESLKELPAFGIVRNDTMFWNKFDTMLIESKIK